MAAFFNDGLSYIIKDNNKEGTEGTAPGIFSGSTNDGVISVNPPLITQPDPEENQTQGDASVESPSAEGQDPVPAANEPMKKWEITLNQYFSSFKILDTSGRVLSDHAAFPKDVKRLLFTSLIPTDVPNPYDDLIYSFSFKPDWTGLYDGSGRIWMEVIPNAGKFDITITLESKCKAVIKVDGKSASTKIEIKRTVFVTFGEPDSTVLSELTSDAQKGLCTYWLDVLDGIRTEKDFLSKFNTAFNSRIFYDPTGSTGVMANDVYRSAIFGTRINCPLAAGYFLKLCKLLGIKNVRTGNASGSSPGASNTFKEWFAKNTELRIMVIADNGPYTADNPSGNLLKKAWFFHALPGGNTGGAGHYWAVYDPDNNEVISYDPSTGSESQGEFGPIFAVLETISKVDRIYKLWEPVLKRKPIDMGISIRDLGNNRFQYIINQQTTGFLDSDRWKRPRGFI
jgi:hypothetical protein